MARRHKNSPAFLMGNPKRRRKRRKNRRGRARRSQARRVVIRTKRRRKSGRSRAARARRLTIAMNPRKRRRRRSRRAAMIATNPRRRRRRSRRVVNSRKRHRRHRNPGMFSSILAPIKEHGIGFGLGSLVNHFALDPLLASFFPSTPIAIGPSKLILGPVIAGLGKKFLPRFGRVFDSFALFMTAIGIDNTVGQLVGAPTAAAHGLGRVYQQRMRSIGPTARGIGSIGPTHMRGLSSIGPTRGASGLGNLTPTGETYAPYSTDGSY